MEAKQQIELTIRTATLLKSLSQLVGVEDPHVAKMMFAENIEQFEALGGFISSLDDRPRSAPRR
jgi:hypothetical protein